MIISNSKNVILSSSPSSILTISLIILLNLTKNVWSYGAGAEQNACQELTPHHLEFVAQSDTQPPYKLHLQHETPVKQGNVIQLTIKGNSELDKVKGFMVQARNEADKPVGHFYPDDQFSHAITCFNGKHENNTLTHNRLTNGGVNQVNFKWIAPRGSEENVYFRVTYVRTGAIFWVEQRSSQYVYVQN